MDKIENLIKNYLEKNLGSVKANKTAYCPDEEILLGYLSKNLNQQEQEIIENHISGCRFCLSQLSLAFQAHQIYEQGGFEEIPEGLINKTKTRLKIDKPGADTKIFKKKSLKKNFFLTGAIIFFALSFFIPKYFIQFLVAALILGIGWVFESESGRTLIMVLDSWRRHSRDDDEEISQRLKKRTNSRKR